MLTKNPDLNKYKLSGYGIGFNTLRVFSLSDGNGFAKDLIVLGAHVGSP